MSIPDLSAGVAGRIAQCRREIGVRLHRDVSQTDIARAVGVSASSVSTWESGEKAPRRDMVERLASLFGVQPGYLLFGTAPKEAAFDEATARAWIERGYGAAPLVEPMEEADAPERAAVAKKRRGA